MANDLYPVAGMRFFMGGAISVPSVDMTEADFETALASAVEIDGWINMGAIGDNSEVIKQAIINRGRDYKMKGTADAGSMQNVFAVMAADPGQIALIAAASPANKSNYAFMILGNDAAAQKSSTVTITNGSNAEVSWAANGLVNGAKVKFSVSSGGSLPTGLTAGTEYYVVNTATDKFSVSTTKGGTAVTTSSAGSGTFTATTVPQPGRRMFAAMAMSAQEAGGEANTARTLNATLEINSNIVSVGRSV